MASLVLELQREALDSSILATDLLRKALVVARKLGIEAFKLWVESELTGYDKGLEIPIYRIISGQIKVWNPYHGWQDFFINDPEAADILSRLPNGQPIGEIENLIKRSDKNSSFHMSYPKKTEAQLMDSMEYPPLKPALLIDGSRLSGIIEAVRNIVLNWTLKLEEDGILGEGMTFSKEEKQVASSHVYNIQNFIESMTHSQIQQDTRDSVQTMSINEIDVSKVLSVLDEIKMVVADLTLSAETKEELSAEITTVETQAKSPKPKTKIIRESLHSIRNILEGTTGSLISSGILEQLKALLGSG